MTRQTDLVPTVTPKPVPGGRPPVDHMDARAHSIASALGRHKGVRVQIEPDGKRVCTDGTTIYTPPPASDSVAAVSAWAGRLDHETAHVRYTRSRKHGGGCAESTEYLRALPKDLRGPTNALEDARVNAALCREYPGCRTNLTASCAEATPNLTEALRGNETQGALDYIGSLGGLCAIDPTTQGRGGSGRVYSALSDKQRAAWDAGATYASANRDAILGARYCDDNETHARTMLDRIRAAAVGDPNPPASESDDTEPGDGDGGDGEGESDTDGTYRSPFGDSHGKPKGKGKRDPNAKPTGEPKPGESPGGGIPPDIIANPVVIDFAKCGGMHPDYAAGPAGAALAKATTYRAAGATVARALASMDSDYSDSTRERTGRLSPATLGALAAGCPVREPYHDESRVRGASVRVHMTIDTSGSMGGQKFPTAAGVAYVLAEAMNRRDGCRATVGGLCVAMRSAAVKRPPAGTPEDGRTCVAYQIDAAHGLAKFGESFSRDAPGPNGSTYIALDIREATKMVATDPAERRIVLAMTDGGLCQNDDAGLAIRQAHALGVEVYLVLFGDSMDECLDMERNVTTGAQRIPASRIIKVDASSPATDWSVGLARIIRRGERSAARMLD